MTLRTRGDGKHCGECCSGDRCDDSTHFDRAQCPHCKGTSWALWTAEGRADYAKYLQVYRGMSEAEATARIDGLVSVGSSSTGGGE